jgi:DNA-binding MarR family transcriptional regulator
MSTKVRTTKQVEAEHALNAWLAVVKTYNMCDSQLARLLANEGYTIAKYEVVIRLKREPDQTQQALADQCFQAKSGISMLLKVLEEDGWVLRLPDAQDARVKRLRLSPIGHTHAQRMLIVQNRVITAMAEGMSKAQLLELSQTMDQVSERLMRLE